MEVLDFHRSYFVFEIDMEAFPPKTVSDMRQNTHNRARIRIDCYCRITDPSGRQTHHYLGESCRTERVGVGRDIGIFTQPNADFRPIADEEDTIILKSWDKTDRGVMLEPPSLGPQTERQVVRTGEAFLRHRFDLKFQAGQELRDAGQVIEAVDAGRPIVARTEFEAAGYKALIEHPVFTINVSERHMSYQTDTGPVVYPDLASPFERAPEALWLAYSAFNSPDWVEFIVQRPTPVGSGISVNHYSETVHLECRNSLFATD